MRKLTCYAWGKPGDWEALCVDLDIAAEGETFEQVRSELSDAVETFVDYVWELPEIERRTLLNRKAPLNIRFRLAIASKLFGFTSALKLGAGGRGIHRAEFSVTPSG